MNELISLLIAQICFHALIHVFIYAFLFIIAFIKLISTLFLNHLRTRLITYSLSHSFVLLLGVTRLSARSKSSLQMSFDSKYFKKEAASMADTTEFVVKGLINILSYSCMK